MANSSCAINASTPGGARYRPVYRVMFYLFIMDIFVLAYVGTKPVTPNIALLGQIATFIYFSIFLTLPWVSKKEEAYLCARRLPPEVEALIAHEELAKAEAGNKHK